jgi:3-isopropylmalate/(R)-2-methylmalate dehydratase small subunit
VLSIDLQQQMIGRPDGTSMRFEIDVARKMRLIEGLDDIDRTLAHVEKIQDYERRRSKDLPWL